MDDTVACPCERSLPADLLRFEDLEALATALEEYPGEQLEPDRAQATDEGGVSLAPRTLFVHEDGVLRLHEEQARGWGLLQGAEVVVEERPDGLFLRPADPPLRKLYVEPTTACNLDCAICVRHSWAEPGGTMPMTTYGRLVDGLREVPSLDTIAFWGLGEPLLHPGIIDMVRLANELGVKTELITNGLLLDPGLAEGLVLAGLDTLIVSVDGTSSLPEAPVRGIADPRLVQQRIRNVRVARHAHDSRKPEIGLEFVATHRNLSQLPGLRRLAYSMGAAFVVVTNVLPYTREFADEILYSMAAGSFCPRPRSMWSPEIVLPRMDARPEYLGPLLELLRGGGSIAPLLGHPEKGYGYCRFVREGTAAIGWDGGVSPCIALMHSYTCYIMGREKAVRRYQVANVNDEPIATIWQRDELRRFRRRVVDFDFSPCADCGGCQYSESNEEDCFGNQFPVCGDCLWARGIIQCP